VQEKRNTGDDALEVLIFCVIRTITFISTTVFSISNIHAKTSLPLWFFPLLTTKQGGSKPGAQW
jgi:hypothetical protein